MKLEKPGYVSTFEEGQNPGVMDIIANTDRTFAEFVKIFHQSVVDRKFHRFGSKASRKQGSFNLDDFVLVLLATGVKYGLGNTVVSKHTVEVKLLNKRNKTKTLTRL